MRFSNEDKKEILLSLEKAKGEAVQSIEGFKKSSQPVSLDDPIGRVSRIDAIQQQQMALASLRREELRLQKIEAAIHNIDSEEFGYCLQCEEEIALKRIQARPESRLCMSCAK